SQEGLYYPYFINTNRLPSNWLYTLLCVDFSDMQLGFKSGKIVNSGEKRDCLPRLLADAGYDTIYVQAPPSIYMDRGRFMHFIGISERTGSDQLPIKAKTNQSWGAVDSVLFKNVASIANGRTKTP